MILLVILGYVLLAAYELIPLYKHKSWKDFYVNIALSFLSFTIIILLCLDVKIPSPAKPIQEYITSMFGK